MGQWEAGIAATSGQCLRGTCWVVEQEVRAVSCQAVPWWHLHSSQARADLRIWHECSGRWRTRRTLRLQTEQRENCGSLKGRWRKILGNGRTQMPNAGRHEGRVPPKMMLIVCTTSCARALGCLPCWAAGHGLGAAVATDTWQAQDARM